MTETSLKIVSNLPQNSSISLLSAPQLFLEKIFILDNYF